MKIEDLWLELESVRQAPTPGVTSASPQGWVLRLARPDPTCLLHVGIELSTGRRGLLLQVSHRLLPGRRSWPRCKGLEVMPIPLDPIQVLFGVVLADARHTDLFTVLAEDLVRRVGAAGSAASEVSALLSGLSRWQKFLEASLEGLSADAQRGLWGELHFLRDRLLPALGPAAVQIWKGPSRAHQDFQSESTAIEVKTTLAKQPQVIRITSERQLDSSNWVSLFLHVLVLDARETDSSGDREQPSNPTNGETLPAMVASLRALLAAQPQDADNFENLLIQAGYADAHAPRYSSPAYAIRRHHFFQVVTGFPCISEQSLPAGVGDIEYALTIAACEQFKVSPESVLQAINQGGKPKQAISRKKRYA